MLSRTVRNVIESIATKNSLPNNQTLPCNIPLPIPAYNSDYPLEYNSETELYFQPRHDIEIKNIISRRHLDIESQTAKSKVSDFVVYSPPLLRDPNNEDPVITFKLSFTALKLISISDGSKAISISMHHVECWSHLAPDYKNTWKHTNGFNLSIPQAAIADCTSSKERKALKTKLENKVKNYIRTQLNNVREVSTSAFATVLFGFGFYIFNK